MKVRLTPSDNTVLVVESRDVRLVQSYDPLDRSDTRVLVSLYTQREPLLLTAEEYEPLREQMEYEDAQRRKMVDAARLNDDMGV